MRDTTVVSDDWKLYQQGIDYKLKLNLFNIVNRNESFYAGDHWRGIDTRGMPEVRFGAAKRIINWKVSQIAGDAMAMRFSIDNSTVPGAKEISQLLSDYSKTTWERLRMDAVNEQMLLDAALSGDGIVYFPWNSDINAGQGIMGDIDAEPVDNTCVFFGNTSESRINSASGPVQPYMLLVFRKPVQEVRAEAKKYGATREMLDLIVADTETEYRSGDRARYENDVDRDMGNVIVLLKFWQKDGTIWARKSVRGTIVRKDWNTGLHRYPIASMPWQARKNSCHGEAEATELIPNNIAINKLMATMILWTMLLAWPKVVYDHNRIQAWSNDITKAIPVDGDVGQAAVFLQPQGLPPQVQHLFNLLVQQTKEMAGANETALGDDSITRTASGIAALQRAATLPLNMVKRRFIQWVEDVGLIWLDYWLVYYGAGEAMRTLAVERHGQRLNVPFDTGALAGTVFGLRVDVGAATQWSEILSIQTLDNLLHRNLITFKQYLERIYGGVIPKKQDLIDEILDPNDKAVLYELMAGWIGAQPLEVQQQLAQMQQANPEQFEQQVKQMILQGGGGMANAGAAGVPNVQSPANVYA